MHPTTSAALAEQRRSDMRADAARLRAVRAARAARPARTPMLATLLRRLTRRPTSASTSTVAPAASQGHASVPVAQNSLPSRSAMTIGQVAPTKILPT